MVEQTKASENLNGRVSRIEEMLNLPSSRERRVLLTPAISARPRPACGRTRARPLSAACRPDRRASETDLYALAKQDFDRETSRKPERASRSCCCSLPS